jgi:predicted TIM-barrel fold metal-dependent hydrolase
LAPQLQWGPQPAGRQAYTNKRPPSDYFKTNILVDTMGFNPIGLRAAVQMCGVDRVVFGSDYGPIPYGIKEHVQIVEDVLPSPAERQLVFWKTSNKVFRRGLSDSDLVIKDFRLPSQDRCSPISAVA